LIYPDDANSFSTLMDVTWQSLGRNYVDKKTKQYWFGKLQKYSLGAVTESFDKWLTNSNELPTIPDIVKGCIPKNDFYKALGYIPDAEIRKEGVAEIERFVASNINPKTDYHAWFKRILANPQNFPSDSVSEAKRVASEFGYKREVI
jgi:hypothetical protein